MSYSEPGILDAENRSHEEIFKAAADNSVEMFTRIERLLKDARGEAWASAHQGAIATLSASALLKYQGDLYRIRLQEIEMRLYGIASMIETSDH